MNTLNKIQQLLKVPKGQENAYGGFRYRSCEDILEAVKPLLGNAVLTLHDEIVLIGDRYYVKATAELIDEQTISRVSAFAREAFEKTKMDASQITGASSSYARKYALNGLFLIDDTKDADTMDNSTKGQNNANKGTTGKNDEKFFEAILPTDEEVIPWQELLESSKTLREAQVNWKKIPPMVQDKLKGVKEQVKAKLNGKTN